MVRAEQGAAYISYHTYRCHSLIAVSMTDRPLRFSQPPAAPRKARCLAEGLTHLLYRHHRLLRKQRQHEHLHEAVLAKIPLFFAGAPLCPFHAAFGAVGKKLVPQVRFADFGLKTAILGKKQQIRKIKVEKCPFWAKSVYFEHFSRPGRQNRLFEVASARPGRFHQLLRPVWIWRDIFTNF